MGLDVVAAAPGVWHARTRDVGWTLVTDGPAVTLIDAGYPGTVGAVRESLDRIGHSWADVVAVLVTHAHVDHVGGLPELLAAAAVPVFAAPAELPNLDGTRHESATTADVVRNAWRPGVLPWSVRIARLGATRHVTVPSARGLPTGAAADLPDLPGRPVAVATPGHTSGHTAYLLPDAGVLVTGDTLVTAHSTSRRTGPQLLLPMFDHDPAGVVAALDVLAAQPADIVLPGHGPVHHAPIAAVVGQVRDRL